MAVFGASSLLTGCMGPGSRSRCERQDECSEGICSNNGFCRQECKQDRDCPCGAICAVTCGLCIRLDTGDPATCFAHSRGLSREEARGACAAFVPPTRQPASQIQCVPTVEDCPTFRPLPSEDAVDGGARDQSKPSDSDGGGED
jgi:hypothetical protein